MRKAEHLIHGFLQPASAQASIVSNQAGPSLLSPPVVSTSITFAGFSSAAANRSRPLSRVICSSDLSRGSLRSLLKITRPRGTSVWRHSPRPDPQPPPPPATARVKTRVKPGTSNACRWRPRHVFDLHGIQRAVRFQTTNGRRKDLTGRIKAFGSPLFWSLFSVPAAARTVSSRGL